MHQIICKIYGQVEVEEVIYKLIHTPTFMRLKGVHQGGAIFLINEKISTTRYEHSIGTFILSKKLGGNIINQISALLHDISHQAFSHVIDYILNNKKENYHESIFEDVVKSNDMLDILDEYNIDVDKIINDDYPILHIDLPHLSIDRIDYILRDLYSLKLINNKDIHEFIDALKVVNNKILLNSIDKAYWFHKYFYKAIMDFYLNPLNIIANDTITKYFQLAFQKIYITLNDFFYEDLELLELVKKQGDKELEILYNKINKNIKYKLSNRKWDINRKFKKRIIDPSIYFKESIYKLSEIDKNIEDYNKKSEKIQKKPIKIRFLH